MADEQDKTQTPAPKARPQAEQGQAGARAAQAGRQAGRQEAGRQGRRAVADEPPTQSEPAAEGRPPGAGQAEPPTRQARRRAPRPPPSRGRQPPSRQEGGRQGQAARASGRRSRPPRPAAEAGRRRGQGRRRPPSRQGQGQAAAERPRRPRSRRAHGDRRRRRRQGGREVKLSVERASASPPDINTAAPGGARRAGRAPPGHRVHQDARRGLRLHRQAVPPEGHRPRPRRLGQVADRARAAAPPSGPSRAATRSRSTARPRARRSPWRCPTAPRAATSTWPAGLELEAPVNGDRRTSCS